MTSAASLTSNRPREDHFVHLRGVRWSDYQRILEVRGDRSAPRVTYLKGLLEILSPSQDHETIKSIIGCLVEVWCLENDIDFGTYGSWTLENKEAERGAEPDECYVFGEVVSPTRPQLAIEVVWTSGGINKLEVYRMLGVPEVWYWRQGHIEVYTLRQGAYQQVSMSDALPGIDLDVLASFLDVRPTSKAIRAYRDALRK